MRIASVVLLSFFVFSHTQAQSYPDKPVRIIAPFASGGVVDLTATAVGDALSAMWKQQVKVEYHPGGGGTTGTALAAKAPADGYTLLVSSSAFAANPVLHAKLPYDPQKSFVAVSALATSANILVVSKDSGYRSLAELIAAAKRNPGQMKYGSVGAGSGTHFAGAKFVHAAGISAAHVPQDKGGANAVDADLKAGRIAFWMAPMTSAMPHIRDGWMVPLAVTTPRRSAVLPDVPTIAESALPGFDASLWYGMWAPAGTPAPVIARLRSDVPAAVNSQAVRERFEKNGVTPFSVSGEDFANLVRNETAEIARIARAAGITPQH